MNEKLTDLVQATPPVGKHLTSSSTHLTKRIRALVTGHVGDLYGMARRTT